MTVESVTYISDLDDTYPVGTDPKSEGDDHIRRIKTGLSGTFPNFTGAAMTATEAELNNLDGYTGNTNDLNILSGASAAGLTAAELQYIKSLTSDAQTQLNYSINSNLWEGLRLSNGTDSDHDIDIAVGLCADSSSSYILELSSALTKQIDAAWATGDAAGGLFSGTVTTDTWYHVFLIRKDSDSSIDAGFDTSITAANIPAGYTAYRRIGSVRTDGSSNILAFHQTGDYFRWSATPRLTTSEPTSETFLTVTYKPLGVPVILDLYSYLTCGATAGGTMTVRSPEEATGIQVNYVRDVYTGESNSFAMPTEGEGFYHVHTLTTSNTSWIDMKGYTDKRGKD